MNFELTGRLLEKFDTQQITDTFRKREFILETKEMSNGREFIEMIKFQLLQDRCEALDNFKVNDEINVKFNIRGRKWEKEDRSGYITSLDAWRIEKAVQDIGAVPPPMSEPEADSQADGNFEDDLPF